MALTMLNRLMKQSALSNIPKDLATLDYGQQLQEKAAAVGFEWKEKRDLLNKLHEEISELQEAIDSKDKTHIEEELGDVLFVLVNFARMNGINAERALQKGNAKFERRFHGLEDDIAAMKRNIQDISLDELIAIWNKQKGKGL